MGDAGALCFQADAPCSSHLRYTAVDRLLPPFGDWGSASDAGGFSAIRKLAAAKHFLVNE
ncbi:protein of unknown function [Paraburkholderia dioscoreae]|uniref:Uncharacterized protein n=1 Tax=Paraburkholderia dioscoreae TaxID=2604047 RepID=A0A5Q4ZTW7_9BURK|nr:protein of unknown function [Paraburkholderia dioscoreae]